MQRVAAQGQAKDSFVPFVYESGIKTLFKSTEKAV